MNGDGKANSQLQEVNHHLQDKSKRGEDVVVGLPQDLVDDDQMNGTKIFDDVKASCQGAVQESVVLQMPQQQSQGTTVCWERFLHLRTLRVLLVENDDCTRLVVAALLRNCSYEVTEASNGLQAWKILEDLTNHIDLVLTEVVLPCLSGIALLSKIMSHRTRKNIPVIMMSSLDPMGLVFKCLSKGAVDFLVKPIRKNELKNLWQHIWRRCHSSSGSGSESGTQTQKSIKSKRLQNPENNTGSNDEDNNGSISLNVGDESDDGSGTQSSWTKQDMEVESPRLMSPGDRVTEHPDSTCAQFIYSNAEIAGIRKVSGTAEKECQEPGEQYENVATLNMDVGHRSIDLQLENQPEAQIRPAGANQNDQLDTGSSKFCEQIDRGQMMDLNNKSPLCNPKYEAGKFCGGIAKITDIDGQNSEYGFPNKHSKMFGMHSKAIKDSEELPFMELSLKRLRGVKDVETTIQDERNVLRRSGSSAFSRYNTVSNANKGPGVKVESASQDDNNLEVRKKGSESDIQSHSIGDPIYQSSNGGSNNMDMGSTTNNAFLKPVGLKKKSEVSSTIHCLNTSSSFKLMKNDLICGPQQVLSDKGDNLVPSPVPAQPRSTHQELQIQYLIHHYDNCHHLVHNMQQHLPHEHDQLSVKKMAEPVPHCGSSNMLGGSFEGNAGNYSVNGSASGSNHGSNGKNGSSTAVNPGEMNAESDTGAVGKGGSGDVSGSGSRSGNCGSGNRVDQNKSAQREAALTKFRQKKKERYFRKKVQYQNRKKLAERPQVQFVRQTANDSTSRGSER